MRFCMEPIPAARHDIILLHVLYAAMTRWIPVPLADEIAANIVRRQMLSKLAESHALKIEKPAIKILADEDFGCLYGCVFGVLLFPIKLIVGKLFLLFRLKRLADQASRHYHAARLTEFAFRTGLLATYTPAQIRAAIDYVCLTTEIGPVGAAFKQVLKKQTGVLKDVAALFTRSLRGLRGIRTEEKVQAAVQSAEVEAQGRVSAMLAPFRDAMNAIPPEHFERLEALFSERLKNPPQ